MNEVSFVRLYAIGRITATCEQYLQDECHKRCFTDELKKAILVKSPRELPKLRRGEYIVRFDQDKYGWLSRIDSSCTCK